MRNKKRIVELCDELEHRGVKKYWMTQGRTDFAAEHPDLIARPAKNGLVMLLSGFTLHVEQDVDHGAWLEEALVCFGESEVSRTQVRRGALLSLEARAQFWTGVQREVVRWRQPSSIRVDGAAPRGIAHELLLTAWDGMREHA